MVVNTPYGNSGPRIDGYEIRSAAVARGHPVHHHRAGRRRGGAGHRGGAAATGSGCGRCRTCTPRCGRPAREPGLGAGDRSGPTARGAGGATCRGHAQRSGSGSPRRSPRTGRCASGSTRIRACSPSGGSPTTRDGLERFALTPASTPWPGTSPWSSRSRRSSSGTGRAASRCWRRCSPGSRPRRPGSPRRCRCSTSSAATSARRWTATPTPTWPSARRWAPTRSRSRPTSASAR